MYIIFALLGLTCLYEAYVRFTTPTQDNTNVYEQARKDRMRKLSRKGDEDYV